MTAVRRVLVCDDSLTIRRLVAMVASNLGIELEMAVSAAEGLAKAQSARPELILLDYVLPDGKGNEVLEKLERAEATASIPVVIMSAKGSSLVEQLGGRPSVVGFLNKPFKPQDLEALLLSTTRRPTREAAPATPEAASIASVGGSMASQASEGTLSRLDDPALAKLLFKVLRGELTKVVEWIGTPGTKVEVAELAKRLIKPAVVRDLRSEIEAACPPRRRPTTGALELLRPMVPERLPGFSARIAGAPLREQERTFLGLVDGNRTLHEIENELKLQPADAANLLDSISGMGLIRMRSGLVGGSRLGIIWLVDDMPGDFTNDLAHYLARFGRRWTLVKVRLTDAADEAQRGIPDGILARVASPEAVANLRGVTGLERVPLAAVFDDSQQVASALLGAGADMALAVPVRTSAIDSFLGISCST